MKSSHLTITWIYKKPPYLFASINAAENIFKEIRLNNRVIINHLFMDSTKLDIRNLKSESVLAIALIE